MTWQEAKAVARRHIERLRLPNDLTGVVCPMAAYDDEATMRFIKAEEPGLTIQEQRMINQAFARELRKRGAKVVFVKLDVGDYLAWLGERGLTNSAANRARYISEFPIADSQ